MASGIETSHANEGTLYQAIISATYTTKKHLDLKKVAPLLYDKKTISKPVRKLIKVSEKTNNMDYFIQALLQLDIKGFALFFSALEIVGDENHRTILSVLSTELKSVNLSKLIKVPSDVDAVETIEHIRSTYFHESIHQGLPEESAGFQSLRSLDAQGDQNVSVEQQAVEVLPTKTEATGVSVPELFPELITAKRTESYSPYQQSSPSIFSRPTTSHRKASKSEAKEYQSDSEASPSFHLKPETHTFSRLTCGTFYSSSHGVSVTITEQAFPSGIAEFELSMTATLESSLPIDHHYYTPCSAIVSLKCDPPIKEFADYVTVEIPHCVLNVSNCEEHLCVLSAPDADSGVEFQEDPEIEVDFTDGRYLVFRTKHFSRSLAAVSKRKRKQKSSSPRAKSSVDKLKKAKSLESSSPSEKSSIDEYRRSQSHPVPSSVQPTAVVEFCVAMFTPRIKAEEKLWKIIFPVACCAVPTALDELEKCALKLLDQQHKVECPLQSDYKQFIFNQPFIKFIPASFSNNGWSVSAPSRPTVISRNAVEGFFMKPREYRESSSLTPHCQQYMVERIIDSPGELKMEITVEGADCYGEKVVFTLLYPSICPTTAGELEISSIVNLYSEDSPIRQALDGTITPDSDSVSLSLDDRDAVSFLAELSFHLREWKHVANLLTLQQADIDNIAAAFSHPNRWHFEAAFQMLRKWVQRFPNTSLFFFLDSLQRAGIVVNQSSWHLKMDVSHSPHEEDKCQFDELLRTRLPKQIASQWRFVARFLGIKESDIDNISECGGSPGPEQVVQQAREMLAVFKSRGLPVWLLRDAVHAVYEHSRCLRDAVCSKWFITCN